MRPVFGLGRNREMPYDYPRPSGLTGGLNQYGGLVNGRGLVHVVDPNFDNMYLDNWFLGVQRSLGSRIAVEADYLGSRGRNAYRKFDINRFNGDMLDGRFDGILPGFAGINYTESTDASTFHGGTVAVRMNRADLQFIAAYTFGKATDYSSSFSAAGRPDAYGPPDQEKGPADFDVRQKLAMSANWTLPSPAGGMLRAFAGGWQLAGVLVAQTGTPFSVVCNNRGFIAVRDAAGRIVGNSGCDFNADNFTGNDRPNVPSFGDSRERPLERRLPERHLHGGRLPHPGAWTAWRARTQYVPRAALLQRGSGAGEDRPHAVGPRHARRRSAAPAGDVQPVQHVESQQPGQQHDQRHVRPIGRRATGADRAVLDEVLVLDVARRQPVGRAEGVQRAAAKRATIITCSCVSLRS